MGNTVNYLEKLDAANPADQLQMAMDWMYSEPLSFFKQMREQRPIMTVPGAVLLARYEDVVEVLTLPEVFTVAFYKPKMGDYLMTHDDDALHYREKSIMQSLINRDDIPRVREMVGKIGKEILDGAGSQIEFVNDFCRMVPVTFVQQFFGLDGIDKKDLLKWTYWSQYNTFHNQPFQPMSDSKRAEIIANAEEGSQNFGKYIATLIVRKTLTVKVEQAKNMFLSLWYLLVKIARFLMGQKTGPYTDDIVTRMIKTCYPEEVGFPIQRLGLNVAGLLVGTVETTSRAVAQIVSELFSRPEMLAKATAAAQGSDNDSLDAIVWEAARFSPIFPYLFRQSASHYTVAKGTDRATLIPMGSTVLALTHSAMFDPTRFENPDSFMPNRPWFHNFHLGIGLHECLGKYVAMVMVPEMVRQLLLRPGVQPVSKMDYKQGPFPEEYRFSLGSA